MNFHSPGWLHRYLTFRSRSPLPIWRSLEAEPNQLTPRDVKNSFTVLDDEFYTTVRQSGVLFGSPVLSDREYAEVLETRLMSDLDRARLVNLDVLFTNLIREIFALAPGLGTYSTYFSRALIRVVQFYLDTDIKSNFFNQKLESLLEDRSFRKMISAFEKRYSKRVRILTKFALSDTLQNNDVFLDIYGLIQWNRLFNQRSRPPVYYLQRIEAEHIRIQRQLCLIFAGILWQTEINTLHPTTLPSGEISLVLDTSLLPDKRDLMLKRYVQTTRLPGVQKRDILKIIKSPVDISPEFLSVQEPVILMFMLEQTLLLALINSESDPFQLPFIRRLAEMVSMSADELRARISSVADFFHQNEERFDFIRGNRALFHMRENLNQRLHYIVQKNMNRILKEIKRTGELYSLLSRHDGRPLSSEEKKFVREQLLSIAKTIPALAIFCLPAGGMVLAVLIKVLPFNILPNSFAE